MHFEPRKRHSLQASGRSGLYVQRILRRRPDIELSLVTPGKRDDLLHTFNTALCALAHSFPRWTLRIFPEIHRVFNHEELCQSGGTLSANAGQRCVQEGTG